MSDSQKSSSEPVIACNPKAISSDKRDNHEALAKEIFSTDSVREVKELVKGYGSACRWKRNFCTKSSLLSRMNGFAARSSPLP